MCPEDSWPVQCGFRRGNQTGGRSGGASEAHGRGRHRRRGADPDRQALRVRWPASAPWTWAASPSRRRSTRAGVAPEQVDYVLMGQVILAGQGQITARQAAVKGGIPMSVPATTINKVCLSGLNTIYLADLMIRAGDAEIVVAGGMESMTQAPYLLPGARAGYRIGDADAGRLHDVRRADRRLRPHRHGPVHRAATTRRSGSPVSARTPSPPPATRRRRRPSRTAAWPRRSSRCRCPSARVTRSSSTPTRACARARRPSRSARCEPAFDKDGTITAGNASQISDGGAAVVVMSAAKAKELGLSPLGQVVGYGMVAGPDNSLLTQPSQRHRQGRCARPASTSAPSTSSRSTRPSPPSGWPRWTNWASTRTR